MSGEQAVHTLWLTTDEAAAQARCHRETMKGWCQQGVVQAKKFGRKWLIYAPSLNAAPGAEPLVVKPRRGRPPKKRVA